MVTLENCGWEKMVHAPDQGRTLAITPSQGVTEGCVAHAINHTCHTDFENCKFVHSGITNVPRGGGRQKDEKVARCRRTSVVYVRQRDLSREM